MERRDKINKEKISIRVSLSFILSLIMILLPMSCGKEVPTSPLDETVQQDIWCKLNFKLKIKANPATEETEGARFEIKAHGQNIIHTLEKELQIENQSAEGEWNNIDGFKTGNVEYRFELCYLAHASTGSLVSGLSTYSGDVYDIKLKVIPVSSYIIVSPESFSETCSFIGIGDRKYFKFKLSRR